MDNYQRKADAHKDPRFRAILERIGYKRRDMTADTGASYLREDLRASGDATPQAGAVVKATRKRAPKASPEVPENRELDLAPAPALAVDPAIPAQPIKTDEGQS